MAKARLDGSGWREGIRYLGDGTPFGETRYLHRFVGEINEVQLRNRKKAGTPTVQRAFHAKLHGGIGQAEFIVSEQLAEELRVGPFQPGARLPATIRFSNAAGTVRPDPHPDLRGLALRLQTPTGLQDLLLTNAPVSHVQDAHQFLQVALAEAASRTRIGAVLRMAMRLGPVETWRTVTTLLPYMKRQVASLLTETYWGRVPYAFGEVAVRFRLQPEQLPPAQRRDGDHYLRLDLVERLRSGPAAFRFQIQRYRDEATTPIERAREPWDTPFETIGRLVIARQDLDTPRARDLEARIEALQFNPWHTDPAIEPIGSLNRARRLVYEASQHLRTGLRTQAPHSDFDRLLDRAVAFAFGLFNRLVPWHRLPRCPGLLNLKAIRDRARRTNLHDHPAAPGLPATTDPPRPAPYEARAWRTADGRHNDLLQPWMGAAGTRFGRNVPLDRLAPQYDLDDPDPHEISERLLKRESFIPIRGLNLLAAAWIQFQVHGWFNHRRLNLRTRAPEDILWTDPRGPTRLARTPPDPGGAPGTPPGFANTETHWWDGSQLYGSSLERQRRIRGLDGERRDDGTLPLRRGPQGDLRLPLDPEVRGVELTGFNDNWWMGLSLFHTLFAREHNAICAALRAEYPAWDAERVFQTARLINAALMAKIHTVQWSPALLGHPTIELAFDTYWWGLAARETCRLLSRIAPEEVRRGLPGSPTDHHGVPYRLTEEFVSVYRMHPLLPDEICIHRLTDAAPCAPLGLDGFAGAHTAPALDGMRMADALYSFGLNHPGALTLFNYPEALRNHSRIDGEHLDLAIVDILRDRERRVPRYNAFRRALHLPPVRSFQALTPNREWAAALRDLYGDIDKVDTLVGMLAEVPPQGFGFSETAFRVFIVMASRRLQSDRFFTTDYRAEVYTPLGLQWVADNDLVSVLLRHHPELAPALDGVRNPFFPWRRLQRGHSRWH